MTTPKKNDPLTHAEEVAEAAIYSSLYSMKCTVVCLKARRLKTHSKLWRAVAKLGHKQRADKLLLKKKKH